MRRCWNRPRAGWKARRWLRRESRRWKPRPPIPAARCILPPATGFPVAMRGHRIPFRCGLHGGRHLDGRIGPPKAGSLPPTCQRPRALARLPPSARCNVPARHARVPALTRSFSMNGVASSLIGHLLSAVNGTAIARGASWLRNAMGEQVLPKGLSILEDPHRPAHFRKPSLRCRRTGDPASGHRGRRHPCRMDTGPCDCAQAGDALHGQRLTRHVCPAFPQHDEHRPDSRERDAGGPSGANGDGAFRDIDDRLHHQRDDGDYSRGAAGFWVENGQITHPVNECTIAGNLRDMLLRIIPANDARAHLSTRVPSLLVEGMTLAGV